MGIKNYHVVYEKAARKAIEKLDKTIRKRILDFIDNKLEGCENPRFSGRNMIEYPNANWRYRVGDYRILADIQDDKIVILVVKVDKRSDVYK